MRIIALQTMEKFAEYYIFDCIANDYIDSIRESMIHYQITKIRFFFESLIVHVTILSSNE